MLGMWEGLNSWADVTDAVVAKALAPAHSLNDPSPREKSLALVRHMATVAQAGVATERLLVLLAEMSKRSWLDGSLVVRLIGDSELTVLELLIDDGFSAERVLPPTKLDLPLDELFAVVKAGDPRLANLTPREAPTDRRIVLVGRPEHRRERRKQSLSAFDTSLLAAVSGGRRVEVPGGTPAVKPPPRAPVAAESEEDAAEPEQDADALAHYDRPSAVLEMPEDEPPAQAPRRRPPPPPRRSRKD